MKEYVVFRKWADGPWYEVASFLDVRDAKVFIKSRNLVFNESYKVEFKA